MPWRLIMFMEKYLLQYDPMILESENIMKIVCFTESLGAGGAQRQLVNLAVMFKVKGHEVAFLTYRQEDFFKRYLDQAGITVYQASSRNYLDRILSVRKYLRTSNADIVLSFLEVPNFIACVSALGSHSWKLITTELSAKPETFKGLRHKIFLIFQRLADKIVCNSKNAEEMWRRNCPHFSEKLTTIYNPIIVDKKETNCQNQCNGFHRTIVIPASYQFIKNPIRLIEAVHRLTSKEREKICIEWYGKKEPRIGDTAAYNQAVQLINAYGLSNVIKLHEQTLDIFRVMEQADAIGLFSMVEGLPNAICEGMMLSKPIIMSRVSDYDMFSSGRGVYLCNPASVESIHEALTLFISASDEELQRMGHANKALAERLFAPEHITEQWMDLFKNMLN